MTTESDNLSLPYIMPAQAQKHVTHNEAIRMLDGLVQIQLESLDADTPPQEPASGERHAIGSNPDGAWTGHPGKLAVWQDGAWAFLTPKPGWLAHDLTGNRIVVHDGTDWTDAIPVPTELQNLELAGIGGTADAQNRLVVASPATLLTHDGNGHQLKINKNTSVDTASLLFQTNWSGRAEFGLTGDDDWHVKVSADGTVWQEALTIDRNTGSANFPNGIIHPQSGALLRNQIFTPGGSNVSTIWRFDEPRTGFPRIATIDSLSGDTITLLDAPLHGANSGQNGPVADKMFFTGVMEGLSFLRLWNISKSPAQACWIMAAPNGSDLVVTDSTHINTWLAGETVQLGEPDLNAQRVVAVDISQFLELHTGSVFRQAGLSMNAGISASGAGGWYAHIAATPDASGGSFSNMTSASPDHDTGFASGSGAGGGFINGFLQVGTTVQSPVSNSNLVFVREYDDGSGALRIGALTVAGVWA